jgi:hypothetical protein
MKGRLVRSVRNAAFFLGLQLEPASAQSVTIELEGQIPVSCGIEALASQITLGDISRPGSKIVPFRVRCNTPFTFQLFSQNNALQTTWTGAVSTGFTNRVPYTVALQIPTNVGAVIGSCPSWGLRQASSTCAYPNSGEGIALSGDALLTISWASHKEPLAGSYNDVMMVVVGARL